MGVDITWRVLDAWPPNRKPTSPRKYGPFKASTAQTIGELEEELAKIKATEVVVELDVDRREQYRGWTALPSITTPSMSTEKAARLIVSFAGGKFSESRVLASAAECRTALQHAMAKTHPDKHLGDVRDFQLVGECKRIMQAHHGVDL
jgi:hypothetical protein